MIKLTVQEETIDDALLAAQLLRQTGKVDPQRVYVLGHSLGGMLAPRIGQQDPSLAGLVMMAATNRPLEDVVLDQMDYLFNLDGKLDSQETARISRLYRPRQRMQRTRTFPTTPRRKTCRWGCRQPICAICRLRAGGDGKQPGHAPAGAAGRARLPGIADPGFRKPQSGAGWKDQCRVQALPGAEPPVHRREGPSSPAEYEIAGHVDPQVIADIVEWIIR